MICLHLGSRKQSHKKAVRKSSITAVLRSTRKPSKKKSSYQAASIKTKVDNQRTSRSPAAWTATRTKGTRLANILKLHHDAIHVVDMESAQQDNFKIYQTLNGCVICFNTISKECIKQVIHIRRKSRDQRQDSRRGDTHTPSKRASVTVP